MGQFGILLVELVHALGEGHHALVGIGGLEGCQLDTAEEEFLHFERIVFMYFLCDDFLDGVGYLLVVQLAVVFSQCLLVFA